MIVWYGNVYIGVTSRGKGKQLNFWNRVSIGSYFIETNYIAASVVSITITLANIYLVYINILVI